jgi:glycosyltransferase involved in cell wall biosynthesis
MTEALITIGITCYREGAWLQECWESVLAQTDDRWVAVMVMDGGNDALTREIFARLDHPKLRKHAMPENVGPYSARNKAFELTETPYHFYLDGDDQLVPDAVRLVLQAFEKNPSAGIVYGDYECFGDRSLVVRYPREVAADDFAEGQPTPGACAYKKETWERLGGFAHELARGNGDYDFLVGAAEKGIGSFHCGDVFYRYRVGNSGTVSSTYARRYHETLEIMVRRHPQFFEDRRRRRAFLGCGYHRAAAANLRAGDREAAYALACTAMRLGRWNDAAVWRVLLESRLPPWSRRPLRGIWRAGRKATGLDDRRL